MSGLHVNLGSGPFPANSWCNVDAQNLPGVDVVASVEALPFEDASVELVYAGHVFEHMTYLEQLPAALAEIRRVLAPGGTMMVVGPDLERAMRSWKHEVMGMWPTDPLGADPAQHSWPPTAPLQKAALEHAGFTAIELDIAAVPNPPWPVVSRIGWQFAFECRIP